jgi:hypothetical protein
MARIPFAWLARRMAPGERVSGLTIAEGRALCAEGWRVSRRLREALNCRGFRG